MLLSYAPKKGGYYVASSDIPKGALIHTEKSIVNIPSPIFFYPSIDGKTSFPATASRCGNPKCFRPLMCYQDNMCSKCKYITYCSLECKDAHRAVHDRECDVELMNTRYNLGIRILASRIKFPFDGFSKPQFTGEDMRNFSTIVKKTVDLFKGEYSITDVIKVLSYTCKLERKYQTVISGYSTGSGLYLLASYFEHSCDPNTYSYCTGDLLHVVASRNIKKGETITNSHDEDLLFYGSQERQYELSLERKINCECPRCTDPRILEKDDRLLTGIRNQQNGKRQNNRIKNACNDWLHSALEELRETVAFMDIPLLCRLHRQFDEFFLPTNALKSRLYVKLISKTLECRLEPPIKNMADILIEFYEQCKKHGIVSCVDHIVAKLKVLKLALTTMEATFSASHYKEGSKMHKKSMESWKKTIITQNTEASLSLARYYDELIYDMDVILCPTLASWFNAGVEYRSPNQ